MLIRNACLSIDLLGHWITRLQFKGKHFIFPRQEIIYEMGNIKMRGGSHPCFPVFGKAPSDFPDLPQHGWLRDQDATLTRLSPSGVKSWSQIGGTQSYPWRIGCITNFEISDNVLTIQYVLNRLDNLTDKAPFNLGLHHYWVNPKGMETNLGFSDPHDTFRGTLNPARKFPWSEANGPVELEILGIGKVEMSMESEGDHQTIVWSDNEKFLCVEQAIDKPDKFGKSSGLHLDSKFSAKFILEFE